MAKVDVKKAGEKWVEVFVAGKHKDMSGNTKEWSGAELDKIAEKYNSSRHEAPAVIGHPALNAPAYGWVKKNLKRVGDKLLAQFRNLKTEFVQAVNDGSFPKRSISVYPDGTLRHVGWLGSMPPAIKGLADVAFSESETFGEGDEIFSYEFNENLLNNFADGGNAVDKDKEIQELKSKLSEQKKAMEELQKQSESKEFAEKEKEKDEMIANLQAENEKLKAAERRKEYSEFCESLGVNLKPGHKNDVMDVMEILNDRGTYEFAEGGSKNAVDKFKTFLKDALVQPQYATEEIVTKKKAAEKPEVTSDFAEMDNVNEEQLELDGKVKSYMKQNNIHSYSEALEKVRSI